MSTTVHLRIEHNNDVYDADPEPYHRFNDACSFAYAAANGDANYLKANIDGNPTYFPKSILENSIITVVITEGEPS